MGGPNNRSRRSLRARLKAVAREARRLGYRSTIPTEIPARPDQLDRLARRLCDLQARYGLHSAIDLLYDLTAPQIAEQINKRLAGIIAPPSAEEVLAQTYFRRLHPTARDRPSVQRMAHHDHGQFPTDSSQTSGPDETYLALFDIC